MRQLENRPGIAQSLHELGSWAAERGEYERAAVLAKDSLALFRSVADRRGVAGALNTLDAVEERQGEYERAATLYGESLALRRALGDRWGVAASLANLGAVAYRQDEHAQAETLLAESLQLSYELGARPLLAAALEILVWVAQARGQPRRTACLAGAAQAVRDALGVPMPPYQRAGHDQSVATLYAALGEEAFALAWAAGATLSLERALAVALAEPAGAEATVSPRSGGSPPTRGSQDTALF
jgi:hypothetical protein